MMILIGRTRDFLSLSVCRCIFAVELWKNEGPPPPQPEIMGSLEEHGQEHGQNGPRAQGREER
jgi:hypothetical protein